MMESESRTTTSWHYFKHRCAGVSGYKSLTNNSLEPEHLIFFVYDWEFP